MKYNVAIYTYTTRLYKDLQLCVNVWAKLSDAQAGFRSRGAEVHCNIQWIMEKHENSGKPSILNW